MSEGAGAWSINASPPCGGAVSLIASHPAFKDLSTASLAGWGCSVHESFPSFPTDWSALAVATDTPTLPMCGVDPGTGLNACGEAYILVAGSEIVVGSKVISISPLDSTNPVGTDHTVVANVRAVGGTPPVPGQLVDFTVTGVNAAATGTCVPVDCKSDANGNVSFTYHDTKGVGDDTVKASFKDAAGSLQTATAQKQWVEGPPPSDHMLTVHIVGSGSASSSPAGTNCPSSCVASFANGTSVGVSATPGPGASFVGWSGDCTGAGACNVTMYADHSVTATLGAAPPPPLPQEIDGEGKVCTPSKAYFEFDDVEGHSDGSFTGTVEFEDRAGKSKSQRITLLRFSGNAGLVLGTGKYKGMPGYNFVAAVVDNGTSSVTPDVVGFVVVDPSNRPVILGPIQPVCRGDVRIHEDHDYR